MSWTLRTSMRPSDSQKALDDEFHAARFGVTGPDGKAELTLNRPTHQAIDMHRVVQHAAVNHLSRETNAPVVVESTGEMAEDGSGSYTITVTVG